jgi:hypothetical protein
MPTRPLLHHRAQAAAFAAALIALLQPLARADCIDDAAAHHQVNALVLRAIGWHESRLQPQALGRNANGSIDVGAFQINSVHLSELGRYRIDRAALADGCTSAEVAAWHYRRQVDRQGNSWQAVGAYHSATPARAAWYANRIATILMQWNALPHGPLPFPLEATLAPAAPPSPSQRGARTPSATPASTAPATRAESSAPTNRPEAAAPALGASRANFTAVAYRPTTR